MKKHLEISQGDIADITNLYLDAERLLAQKIHGKATHKRKLCTMLHNKITSTIRNTCWFILCRVK